MSTQYKSAWIWGCGDKNDVLPFPLVVQSTNQEDPAALPMCIEEMFGQHVSQIACGARHSMVVIDGAVMTWGSNDQDQLGRTNRGLPRVLGMAEGLKDVVAVAAGGTHSMAFSKAGHLFSWGGTLSQAEKERTCHAIPSPTPVFMDYLAHKRVVVTAVAVGAFHIAVITQDGRVMTAGGGGFGRLGHGNQKDEAHLKLVDGPLKNVRVRAVACGAYHTAAVTDAGQLFTFGHNKYGQLGIGNHSHRDSPKLVDTLSREVIVDVSCGACHTAVITDIGQLYCFGSARSGQLGVSSKDDVAVPVLVDFFVNEEVVSVKCGHSHTVALTRTGTVYTWGLGRNGQLGHGDRHNRTKPAPIAALEGRNIISISAGAFHCLAVEELNENDVVEGIGARPRLTLGAAEAHTSTGAPAFAKNPFVPPGLASAAQFTTPSTTFAPNFIGVQTRRFSMPSINSMHTANSFISPFSQPPPNHSPNSVVNENPHFHQPSPHNHAQQHYHQQQHYHDQQHHHDGEMNNNQYHDHYHTEFPSYDDLHDQQQQTYLAEGESHMNSLLDDSQQQQQQQQQLEQQLYEQQLYEQQHTQFQQQQDGETTTTTTTTITTSDPSYTNESNAIGGMADVNANIMGLLDTTDDEALLLAGYMPIDYETASKQLSAAVAAASSSSSATTPQDVLTLSASGPQLDSLMELAKELDDTRREKRVWADQVENTRFLEGTNLEQDKVQMTAHIKELELELGIEKGRVKDLAKKLKDALALIEVLQLQATIMSPDQ